MENKLAIIPRILGAFGLERKSAQDRPDFGRSGYDFNYQNSWRNRLGYGLHQDVNRNYRREVGDLDNSSLVMAVCNDTGIALAEAEPSVRRLDSKGETQPDPGHPLSALIANPNPYHIWEDYCMAGAFSYWADGNWYLQLVRDLAGEVIELWYLPHFMVSERWPDDGRSPEVPLFESGKPSDPFCSHYQYTIPGKSPILIPANDMLHIKRGVNFGNPRRGIGVFEPLITEIYGDQKATVFAATILRNLGIVVPIISPKDKDVDLSATQAAAMKQQWIAGTTGDQAGAPMIQTVPVDVNKFAFSPQEIDLKELQMIPESRVAAVTRYPAAYLQFLVGLKNGTSYASYKEAREQAYESVIEPIQKGIARRITQKLLPEFEKTTKGAYFFFDTSKVRVLQEDQNSLMKRASTGYLAGVIMRSDARRMLKLDITPEDDVFFDPRGGSLVKEGEDPNAVTGADAPAGKPKLTVVPAKGFGSVAEIEQYLGYLENEMKDFVVDAR